MQLKSIKTFERRWAKLKRMAQAQLRDFEKDKKLLAREIKQYKVEKDIARVRVAVAHSKRVEKAIKTTKQLVATKNLMVKEGKRRGRLLARAFR
jgi:hypothetical protein